MCFMQMLQGSLSDTYSASTLRMKLVDRVDIGEILWYSTDAFSFGHLFC